MQRKSKAEQINSHAPAPSKWRFLRHATTPIELPLVLAQGAFLRLLSHNAKAHFEKGVQARPTVSFNSLAMRVFDRLTELTNIPKEKILPRVLTNPHVQFIPMYDMFTHELITSGKTQQLEHHELLHATQVLLEPHTSTSFIGHQLQYDREREPTADHISLYGWEGRTKRTNFALTAAIAVGGGMFGFLGAPIQTGGFGLVAVSRGLGHARELIVRRAIKQYGHDGWIALHAQGRFDPLFATAILHSLERRGFIKKVNHPTGHGFTQKGETWIRSLKPDIEHKLKEIEKNRKQEAHG